MVPQTIATSTADLGKEKSLVDHMYIMLMAS